MKKPKWDLRVYFCYKFTWLPVFSHNELLWKDKFGTPRCEREPSFKFEWLWFGFYGSKGCDQYWEQWLWVNKYHGGDVEKARKEWEWVDYDTKESSWIDYNLK